MRRIRTAKGENGYQCERAVRSVYQDSYMKTADFHLEIGSYKIMELCYPH